MTRSIAGPRVLLLLGVTLLAAPGVAGCAGDAPKTAAWTAGPIVAATMSTMPSGVGQQASLDAVKTAAWTDRPAYVHSDAETEEAYAFALASPDVLKWIPCYCGCATMGHGSNLDCFFKPTMAGLTDIRYEEHASGCRVCVDTALMAKQMLGQGASIRAIRDAVDQTFGGSVPGTPTELPPA